MAEARIRRRSRGIRAPTSQDAPPAGPSLAGRTWRDLAPGARLCLPSSGRAGSDLQDPVALLRLEARDREPLLAEPLRQRVGPQVALHDQVGGAPRLEPGQPSEQQLVQRTLPDPHRRVGVDGVQASLERDLLREERGDVWRFGDLRVRPGEVERALVHVDGPDARLGRAKGEGEGDRPVTAAKVEQVARARRAWRLAKQDQGAEIDSPGAENAPVSLQLEVDP